jgi:nucleoside phosphorylase
MAQQELWPDLVAFEPEVHGLPQKQFIMNMRAVALMESERYTDAKALLNSVLQQAPGNGTALTNAVVLHLRQGDYRGALDAAEHAKIALGPGDLDGVLANEAVAREQLGDKYTAKALLDAVSSEGGRRAPIRALRQRLESGTGGVDSPPGLPPTGNAPPSEAVVVPRAPEAEAPVPVPAPEETGIDVAIVTALWDEYSAVHRLLTDPQPVPPEAVRFPNHYAWVTGRVPKADGSGSLRVVLAWAGQSGNAKTHRVTGRTIDQWRPRYLLFSGIAGGLYREALTHGDVVLSNSIWYYEHGKIDDGRYNPRHRDTFRVDQGLLTQGQAFARTRTEWKDCDAAPYVAGHQPKMVPGLIGSGEKVVDDLKPAFVQAVLKARPELQAVEMEAAGACEAIEQAHDEGVTVGFLMVRGVTDMPQQTPTDEGERKPSLLLRAVTPILNKYGWQRSAPLPKKEDDHGAGTAVRDGWKPYACAISARFVVTWLASAYWPVQPRA